VYWITAKTGFRGRVTVIAIACFKRGFEIESPCASGETDFDPSYIAQVGFYGNPLQATSLKMIWHRCYGIKVILRNQFLNSEYKPDNTLYCKLENNAARCRVAETVLQSTSL
jgi:hypothetical protein